MISRWKREERRYRRLALKLARELPPGRVARSGRPVWHLDVPIDSSESKDIVAAFLAHALPLIRNYRPRRYFSMEIPEAVEHGFQVTVDGRKLRLLRTFDSQRGIMRTWLSVAGA